MRKYGVSRRVVSREELLRIEPAFTAFAHRIVGGTYTASDESGDAREFPQQLAQRCAERGVKFLWNHDVLSLNQAGGSIDTVTVREQGSRQRTDGAGIAEGHVPDVASRGRQGQHRCRDAGER